MNYKKPLLPFFTFITLLLLCFSCNKHKPNSEKEGFNTEQKIDIPIYNFDELEPHLYSNNDQVVIVNFWAMWCAPCVKELPYLQEYAATHPEVSLLLVSLDFKEDVDIKLKDFIRKKHINAPVVLLDDPDANSWINRVSPDWSGAIPFTIISKNKKRFFYERSFKNLVDFANEVEKIKK